MDKQRCLVILGPTAVGKSSFIYQSLPEDSIYVISADSMQIYREFNVGTATPTTEQLRQFPQAGINERSPAKEYSVNEFLELADRSIQEAHSRDLFPVVVGGTGLYLKTFLFGMDDLPPKNESFREKLRREANETSREAIHDRLKSVDPNSAEDIHPNDLKRTIRALEIHHETGRTKSSIIANSENSIRDSIDPEILGLNRPLDELKTRINKRVRGMVEGGLIEEINRLKQEWDVSETVRQAIGYQETIQYLKGNINEDQLVQTMTSNTYEFARKQMNWFRRLPVNQWYHPSEEREELIDHVDSILGCKY